MEPPFPEMRGGKILVSISNGSKRPDIGTFITYQPKGEGGLFGVKIRFAWTTSAMQPRYWDCPLSGMRFDPLKRPIIKITNLRLSYPRADSHPFLLTPFTPSPNPRPDGKTGHSMIGQKLPSHRQLVLFDPPVFPQTFVVLHCGL